MRHVYQSSNVDGVAHSVISPNPYFAVWVCDHPFCLSAGSSKQHREKFDTGSSWNNYSDLFDLFRLGFCEDEWWDRCARPRGWGKSSNKYKYSYIIKAIEFKSFNKQIHDQFADQSNEPGSFKHLALALRTLPPLYY